MKKITTILLCAVFLLTLCSCGGGKPEGDSTANQRKDLYTYEQQKAIEDIVSAEMSIYGFNYSINAIEDDGVINVSIYLHRATTGAEEVFSDTIEWSVNATKKAKGEKPFDLGELCVTFLLYEGPLDGEATGTMSYTTADLEKGNVFITTRNFDDVKSKTGATVEEIRVWITGRPSMPTAELLEAVRPFQGEWRRGKYNRTIINGDTVNFVHENEISGKEYITVHTFFFAFAEDGTLIVNNQHGQPSYNISLLKDGTMQIQSIYGSDEPEICEKISDSTAVPAEKDDPEIGMTELEVYGSSWGYPNSRNKTTTAEGTCEQLVYDFGYIYLTNGIVTAIQER